MKDSFDDFDHCYECTGYGDDYYFDVEKDEWVSACDGCPYNETIDDWNDPWDD